MQTAKKINKMPIYFQTKTKKKKKTNEPAHRYDQTHIHIRKLRSIYRYRQNPGKFDFRTRKNYRKYVFGQFVA